MMVNNFNDAAVAEDRGEYIVLDAPQGSRRGQHPCIAIDRGYSPQSASHRRDTANRGARFGLVLLAAVLAVFGLERPAEAAGTKYCTKDIQNDNCLRAGINSANKGGVNIIWLGKGTIQLSNPLPLVTSKDGLYIVGEGATIRGVCQKRDERGHCTDVGEPVLHVIEDATLVIDSITVTNGDPGIWNEGYLYVYRSTISKNGSHEKGAGIANYGPYVYLQDSTVNNNGSHHGPGAGISNEAGFVEIVNSTIHSNWISPDTSYGGGGIANGSGTLAIGNSTIYGNVDYGIDRPYPHAGGIVNGKTGDVWLGSVTITNNHTVDGFAEPSDPVVGGVFSSADSKGLYFYNTIIAKNGTDYYGPDCGGKVFSLGGNLLGSKENNKYPCVVVEVDTLAQYGVSRAPDVKMPDKLLNYTDPGLEDGRRSPKEAPAIPRLQDNGGSSCTVALYYWGHAFGKGWTGAPGSHPFACAEYDQRGVRRNRSGWTCDIGAYEYRGQSTPSGLECPG